jgi:hypothetical protein
MPKGMQPIYTVNVGAGGATSISFNNIPQTYTDLLMVQSMRSTLAGANWDDVFCQINGATSAIHSTTVVYGINTGITAARGTGGTTLWNGWASGAASTANTFSINQIYIANYSSTGFKQAILDSASEGNSTTQVLGIGAVVHNSNAPITSMRFTSANAATFVQYSSITLYGISR